MPCFWIKASRMKELFYNFLGKQEAEEEVFPATGFCQNYDRNGIIRRNLILNILSYLNTLFTTGNGVEYDSLAFILIYIYGVNLIKNGFWKVPVFFSFFGK